MNYLDWEMLTREEMFDNDTLLEKCNGDCYKYELTKYVIKYLIDREAADDIVAAIELIILKKLNFDIVTYGGNVAEIYEGIGDESKKRVFQVGAYATKLVCDESTNTFKILAKGLRAKEWREKELVGVRSKSLAKVEYLKHRRDFLNEYATVEEILDESNGYDYVDYLKSMFDFVSEVFKYMKDCKYNDVKEGILRILGFQKIKGNIFCREYYMNMDFKGCGDSFALSIMSEDLKSVIMIPDALKVIGTSSIEEVKEYIGYMNSEKVFDELAENAVEYTGIEVLRTADVIRVGIEKFYGEIWSYKSRLGFIKRIEESTHKYERDEYACCEDELEDEEYEDEEYVDEEYDDDCEEE